MRTPDLLRVLAADTVREPSVGTALAAALAAGGVVSLAAVVLGLGVRPDLPSALQTLRVAFKQLWPIWLAVTACGAAWRLSIPGRRAGAWLAAAGAVPIALAGAAAAELAHLPQSGWHAAIMGSSAGACLALVFALAMPILPLALFALRRGAAMSPAGSGALAGLLSGATAASLYALHCTEDSPLFYGTWYVLAVLIVTAIGAAAGRRLLRW